MHFSKSKGTLKSLESVISVFRERPSLGAPEKSQNFELNRLLLRKSSSFASKFPDCALWLNGDKGEILKRKYSVLYQQTDISTEIISLVDIQCL